MIVDPAHRHYDLEERTAKFGEDVIGFARTISLDAVTRCLVTQIVRSATSVGANYVEANEADTRKDFKYRIGICRRESKETRHWLRMIVAASGTHRDSAADLWREADELARIFGRIKQSTKTD